MGRYIFFSTGYEYKLVFALQPSEDITLFGGSCRRNEKGELFLEWTAADIPKVDQRLTYLENAFMMDRPDFANYEKTLDGTYDMKDAFLKRYTHHTMDEIKARYVLGLVIYHQLSYQCPLTAHCDF